MIGRVLKNLTLVYAFLIILGYIYLHTYYESFNIDIYSYLTTNEILLIFLNLLYPVLSILALFLSSIISCLIVYWVIHTIVKLIQRLIRFIKKTRIPTSNTKSIFQINLSFVLSIIISTGFIFYALFKLTGIWGIGSMVIPIVYYLIHYQISKVIESNTIFNKFKISKIRFDICSLAFFLIIMSWYYGGAKAELIQNKSYYLSYNEVSFTYNTQRIIPHDSLIYLGSTNNYFFFRDRKESISKIYPIKKVDQIISGDSWKMSRIYSNHNWKDYLDNLDNFFPNPCKRIHRGRFIFGETLIERDSIFQLEYEGKKGGKINKLKIVWKSNCEYMLYDKNNNLKNRWFITSVNDSTYTRFSVIDSTSNILTRLN